MSLTIAMLQPLTPDLEERVRALIPAGFVLEIAKSVGVEDLKTVLENADYAVAFGMAVPADALNFAPKLRLLHRWGVGVDGTPLEACRERGIMVAKTTGSNARPVAEYTVGAMLASSRVLNIAHATTQQGQWLKKELWAQNIMLANRTIGLVGLGAIGKHVARRLRGFECTVLYNKRERLSPAEESELDITYASFDHILENADIISLHCPLTSETRNLIARPQFERMKSHAMLVNTARGGIVNEQDLADALKKKTIRSAVVDVFETEPVNADNPLLKLDNCIVTPHIAANAFDNVDNGIRHWITNLKKHASGEALPHDDIVIPAPTKG